MSNFIRFTNKEGMVFELKIAGYPAYSDLTCPFDSNWLIIEANVHHPRGNWTFSDPCMLIPEVIYLANWFEAIENGNEKKPYFETMEPELFYRLITNKGQRTLRICFNQNARPLWDQSDDELFIDFPMDDLDLKAASNSLHKQLQLHKSEERTKLEMKPIDEWTTLSV